MKKLAVIIFAILLSSNLIANSSSKIIGVWLNDAKTAQIETYMKGDLLFAKIVWLKEPNNEKGKPKLDINNPNNGSKNRKVLGIDMLMSYRYNGKDMWEDGTIYNVKNGKIYDSYIEINDKDELLLTGYLGAKWLGQTVIWTRVKS